MHKGPISKTRRGHLDFLLKTCVICVFASYLLNLGMGSASNVNYDLTLALVRSQVFESLRDYFYENALKFTCEKRTGRRNVGGVSIRSRNGASSRKGCVVIGEMSKACNI